jgi:hypothetical protein
MNSCVIVEGSFGFIRSRVGFIIFCRVEEEDMMIFFMRRVKVYTDAIS